MTQITAEGKRDICPRTLALQYYLKAWFLPTDPADWIDKELQISRFS
jgi:hypothetical protein